MSRPSRLVVAALAAALTFALSAGVASAHVTVNPREAAQGGYAKLSFRVPNERDDASTTTIAVQLPTDHPLASVSVRPTPGWTYTVERGPLPTPIKTDDGEITEAVTSITWTGGTIAPGEFQEFDVSVGPLPDDADSLSFPAVQTYSDGEVVRWIDKTEAGQAEPEHPAPVLTLTKASDDEATATTEAASATTNDDDGDDSSNGLAIAALVVGALGLVAGAGAIVMVRRR